MKIAVEGCAHGELENIYDTLLALEQREKIKIDLLICCGDFQASRNKGDLICMAVPPKYAAICTFYKYYSGEKTAPFLTIFIGGNHEASNYLQELPYGGWVAPNIYYLGYAGVINIAGLRIAGLSGIYKSRDYLKGHYEKCPYDENSKRSVYHVRNLEVFRLKQLSGKIDVFMSHDWPSDVYKYGNLKQLLKRKPHFKEDVENNQLGSKACEELLHHLKPSYWFAAHLHCKYAALVKHDNEMVTKFLALDKCLPKRKFLQIVDVPHDGESPMDIKYDLEWLAILYSTNHLLNVKNTNTYMPGPGSNERYDFTPTEEEKNHVLQRFDNSLLVPTNFCKTAPAYQADSPQKGSKEHPEAKLNPQTVLFCEKLAVTDPVKLISGNINVSLDASPNQTWGSSFINDSVLEDENDSKSLGTVKKLGSLSLPNPKLNFSEDLIDEDVEKPKEVCVTHLTEEPSLAEENEVSIAEKEEKPSEEPTPRKLKRRNMGLYQSE